MGEEVGKGRAEEWPFVRTGSQREKVEGQRVGQKVEVFLFSVVGL